MHAISRIWRRRSLRERITVARRHCSRSPWSPARCCSSPCSMVAGTRDRLVGDEGGERDLGAGLVRAPAGQGARRRQRGATRSRSWTPATASSRPRPAPTAPCRCCPRSRWRRSEAVSAQYRRPTARHRRPAARRRRARRRRDRHRRHRHVAGRAGGAPLRIAAFVGAPIAVLAMAPADVLDRRAHAPSGGRAATRRQEITAAGLADQRLPVPDAQDEIHRLAVTLNAMLDRIDIATTRQRTFVGDAAHELRSPLASLRFQLEVAQRLGRRRTGPGWSSTCCSTSTARRLVGDLLALARIDEAGGALRRREPSTSRVGARAAVAVRRCASTYDVAPWAFRCRVPYLTAGRRTGIGPLRR